jgi:hypothetical protein
MTYPTELFHASPAIDVTEFEPRNEFPRYPGEAKLIFATPHKKLAAMFLAPHGITTEIGVYGDQYVIFINCSEDDYLKQDTGGAIYSLPVETFQTDTIRGMGNIEWYSNVSVKPISKTIYNTSLEAMDAFMVSRFFVSDEIFQQIRVNPAGALGLVE